MATIPLQLAQRRLDTGNVVSYPEGSPVGRAMQGFGDELSALAEHYRQMKERQEAFDADLARRRFDGQIAQAEDQVTANASADGSGLHDAMYGQVDPHTGKVVKPGLFDTLFGNALPNMPESKRANFAKQKEALRAAGSLRMARRQQAKRDDYEMAEWTKVDNMSTSAIAQSDPNDTANFEAIRQSGFDLIAKIGNPLARQAAEAAWRTNTAKALVQAIIAQNPKRAAEMLGAVTGAKPAVDTVVDKIIGVESGGNAAEKNPNSSASGVGQFLDSTWVQTVRSHRPDIAAGKSASEIIALKGDAELGRQMTAALTRDNAEYLTNRGIPTTPGNLYLAHFLGSAGAVSVLKADPGVPIASVVGQDAVRANPFLAGKTVADTRAWSDSKMGASAQGDTVGKPTSNVKTTQASRQADGELVWAAAPWIADLPPNDLQDLGQKAQVAMTEQLFDARTNVQLAYQNAPSALMYTGSYSGKKPDDEDLTAVYGVEEGGKQSLGVDRTFKAGTQAFEMVRMPEDAIETKVLAARPKPGSATPEQDQAQFEITTSAARQVLQARAADPADFVRKIDQASDADWNAISSKDSYDPAAYQKAVARSVAVQLQLGIKKIQPLPMSVVKDLVDTLNDDRVPQRERDVILRDLFAGTSDPGVQAAMALQLTGENQSRIGRSIANNSAPISAEERVSRNLAAFDALPLPLKPLVALDDTVRLMADGMTFGYADKFAATMNSLISGSSYEEELASERAWTQNARDRAGSAGTAAELVGAYLTGRGLGEAGITLSGRLGTATMKGLSGLLARTGLVAAEGAGYGAVEAAGRDESIGTGTAFGFLGGAGSNVVGEGLGAVYRQAAEWIKRRSFSREPIGDRTATELTSDPPTLEASSSSPAGDPTSPVPGLATTNGASAGHDLHLTYMPHWNAAQRAAADIKVKMLTEAATVVSRAVRIGKSARKIFKKAGSLIPFGNDIDHVIDLQLGGAHVLSNFAVLDSSVNRSLGAQIWNQIKDLPIGTAINKVTIGER
ncbi:lytic transglycosylase domain-containing protein [Mesorhizobium neociceri]|uniref:Uncharacterized protein n=1 Tax=Mesorhizobium neociceri TaxID=1307853 RepID=A0A838BAT0_9HYPH|nr:hypothetical protein [Mesorhizobium neociceri]MBA1143187.1 hypothetical protein [Mesorhizobium neociceri]